MRIADMREWLCGGSRSVTRAGDLLIMASVAAVSLILAATMLADYAADPAKLWNDILHDRNGHFTYALNLALALRDFDFPEFINQIQAARIWPPVHGLVLAFVMLLGGIDVRLAIIPSLLGWVCTMVFTFLIARRLCGASSNRNLAGVIAVTFALASPALRLITADVMLEGLGSGLIAFCLYAYLRARTDSVDGYWWGVLALALTILFFEKSNYWVMTAVPLGIAWASERRASWGIWIRAGIACFKVQMVARAVRDPYLIAASMLLCVVVGLYIHGPASIDVFGRSISLYPPENLVTIVWWILCIRAASLWRKHRERIDESAGIAGRRLFYWHVLPIAVSFLIPKHLSAFIWYVGPTHFSELTYNPLQAGVAQWQAFAQGFHAAPWIGVLVVGLSAVAALNVRQFPPGGRAVLILAALSAFAVVMHPQQQWRFQSTWLFSVWALAGAGAATVLSFATSRLRPLARVVVAVGFVGGIGVYESQRPWTAMAYTAATRRLQAPSDVDLAAVYLPYVRGLHRVGFIGTFPRSPFLVWTVRADCRCRTIVDGPWLEVLLSREEYRRAAADWVGRTNAELIVVIDAPHLASVPRLGWTYEFLSAQIEAIESDNRFERIAGETVPSLGARVTIWRRKPPGGLGAARRAAIGAQATYLW
jgi:hypothetical protein